jgi:hypothetical protein
VVTVRDLVHAACFPVHYSVLVDCNKKRHAYSIGHPVFEDVIALIYKQQMLTLPRCRHLPYFHTFITVVLDTLHLFGTCTAVTTCPTVCRQCQNLPNLPYCRHTTPLALHVPLHCATVDVNAVYTKLLYMCYLPCCRHKVHLPCYYHQT